MAGVPGFISDGPFVGLFLFLFGVVLLRAQGTYWAGRWARGRAERLAATRGEAADVDSRGSRIARRFSGPGMERAQSFLERWGFVGVPVSFLTIGFQTMVNASAGYTRMRWDLYTIAMIPGCIAWAAIYATLGLSVYEAFARAPWISLAVLVGVVAVAFGATRLRRTGDSGARTPR